MTLLGIDAILLPIHPTMLAPNKLFRVVAILLTATIALLLTPMIGFFREREFGVLHVFIKHRPSSTVYFSSPLGESDPPPAGLPPHEAQREAEYIEFVETGGGYRRSIGISN